jgi:hypothetical protein
MNVAGAFRTKSALVRTDIGTVLRCGKIFVTGLAMLSHFKQEFLPLYLRARFVPRNAYASGFLLSRRIAEIANTAGTTIPNHDAYIGTEYSPA